MVEVLKIIWSLLCSVLSKLWNNGSYFLTFVTVIVIGGGAGIWLPVVFESLDGPENFKNLSYLTYGIALMATIIADVILIDDSIDNNETVN